MNEDVFPVGKGGFPLLVIQLLFQFQDISLQNILPTTISLVVFHPKSRFHCLVFHRGQLLVLGECRFNGAAKTMLHCG